jgi:hypothetical protein
VQGALGAPHARLHPLSISGRSQSSVGVEVSMTSRQGCTVIVVKGYHCLASPKGALLGHRTNVERRAVECSGLVCGVSWVLVWSQATLATFVPFKRLNRRRGGTARAILSPGVCPPTRS